MFQEHYEWCFNNRRVKVTFQIEISLTLLTMDINKILKYIFSISYVI